MQAASVKGHALARSGALQARARAVASERGERLARRQQLLDSGRRLGTERAQRHRAIREARAGALGFDSLDAYLRATYLTAGMCIEDLQAQLRASYAAVRADLRRAGIDTRRKRGRRGVAAAGAERLGG